ncbi:MAG: hypothetical protein EHM93_06830 [Bacteroidales bacterium]|nr:MAG: hypothetical protein EHM93_06830 [Bacteroidales bacterium]
MKNVLSTYLQEYTEIRLKQEYAFGLAQDFVAKLLALPPEERYELLPLFKQIENESFEDGIEIPNLNYETLEKDKATWEASSKITTVKKKEKKIDIEDDFNKVLFNFFSKYESFFLKIKGYFVYKLENAIDTKTKVIVLYDESYSRHPEINSFDVKDENLHIEKYQLKDFLELANKKPEVANQNYLCVFLIASNLRNNEIFVPDVEKLLGIFSNTSFISLKKIPVSVAGDYDVRDSGDGLESIKSYSDKIFNNRALSFEEELIIKKLFDGNEMILDYKFLKSGNSGSKVIEIQPLRGNHPEMGRFVVKFDVKNQERKIKKEKSLFRQYISDLLVPNYTAEYEDTVTHEAIRYNYASSDSKKDSFPFSKLVSDKLRDKYNHSFTLEKVIDELFGCAPYQIWNTKKSEDTFSVKTLYGDYLKSEAKILKAISLIKGIDESAINTEELVRNYKTIKNSSLRTYKKICHGDLHSENFFKDEQAGVYLIDFGWTNQHHSLIDHATLECSLKFKHLPFYIPVDELTSCETELLSISSFSKSFDLLFIKRPSVLEIVKLITQIRENAKQHMIDNTNPLEYLISLFIINFRQIQYADLNQSYALATAEVLSKKIIELINE